jgi:hypothetical protein
VASQRLTGRVFGKVDEYGGQLAASTFLHLWVLPILPTGSVWISADGIQPMAHPIRWHWRSIAAAYLRSWAPIFCLSSFVADTSARYALAGVALLLCAWSWTWRMAHRRRAQQLSDFDLVTLGSQCPPERLLRLEQERLLAQKQKELAALATGRSPEDIARFGSAKLAELLAAYAVLRLVAAQTLPSGPWRLAARRIVEGRHDEPDAADGVFRTATAADPRVTAEELTAWVGARARRLRARSVIELARLPRTWPQKILWGGWTRLFGYLALAAAAAFGALMLGNVRDPDSYDLITERRLRDTIATGQKEYRVQCDSLLRFRSAPHRDAPDVYLCQLGARFLPVLATAREGLTPTDDADGYNGALIRGRLHPRHVFRADAPQWELQLRGSAYDDRAAVVYLVTDVFSKAGQLTLALSFLLGSLLLLILWERVRRQRAQMLEEATLEIVSAAAPPPASP